MINTTGVVRSVSFTDQEVRVFGDTAISRGRLTVEFVYIEGVDRRIDRLRDDRAPREVARGNVI